MSHQKTLNVICPECQSPLAVDAETGRVLRHEKENPAPEKDLDQAMLNLKKEADRRAELFKKSIEEQKSKNSRLEDRFREGLKRANDEPDAGRPVRDIDLD